MPRTHSYLEQGKKCYDVHGWYSSKKTNVMGALMGKSLLTLRFLEYNINTNVFNNWVVQI